MTQATQTSGRYRITSILNGTRDGNAITLLARNSFSGNDNILLFPENPFYFTNSGVAYSSNGVNFNIYSTGESYDEFDSNNNSYATSNVTVAAAAPAPHPGGGGLSFLALGLVALGYYRRRSVGRVRVLVAGLAQAHALRTVTPGKRAA